MKYKTMGLFAGALKRVKNSLGHIAKNAGNFITLAGKSKILGMLAPTGLGSFVNKSLEKLGKVFMTQEVICVVKLMVINTLIH